MDGSASHGLALLGLDSRIPVKIPRLGASGDSQLNPPTCVTGGDGTYDAAVEAVSFDDDDLVAYGQAGSSSQHTCPFAVPLSPRVSTRSGSGMACRKSCRSQSRSGDERPPLHPDSHRSSRHRSSLPSPAKHV